MAASPNERKFQSMLFQLEQKLTVKNFKDLARIYKAHFDDAHRNIFFQDLEREGSLKYDDKENIEEFTNHLEVIGRQDLIHIVNSYTSEYFGIKRITSKKEIPADPVEDQPLDTARYHDQETGSAHDTESLPVSPKTMKKFLGKLD